MEWGVSAGTQSTVQKQFSKEVRKFERAQHKHINKFSRLAASEIREIKNYFFVLTITEF